MARIGLLTIATRRYISFVPELYLSSDRYLLPGHEVHRFLFTDAAEALTPSRLNVHQIRCEHTEWPGPTLGRYRIFTSQSDALREMDYLFYCDADMLFVAPVRDEILPKSAGLVGTIHPGFWNKPPEQFPYERRPASHACVGRNDGRRYYAGGFQGGTTPEYLTACLAMAKRIDEDHVSDIVADWHDESHWNRWLIDHPPVVELTPSYCFPESWTMDFEKRLLALDKNHAEMRRR